jgi:hypothetical protein
MRRRQSAGTSLALLALLAATTACDRHVGVHAPAPPPPTALATEKPPPLPVLNACTEDVKQQLQQYLDDWRTEGAAEAARSHLVARMQLPASDEGPRLLSGTVTDLRFRSSSSRTPIVMTFQTELDLRFAGDPGAWGQGVNTRFVAVQCPAKSKVLRFELATSP